jgi:hypothetical protein
MAVKKSMKPCDSAGEPPSSLSAATKAEANDGVSWQGMVLRSEF